LNRYQKKSIKYGSKWICRHTDKGINLTQDLSEKQGGTIKKGTKIIKNDLVPLTG